MCLVYNSLGVLNFFGYVWSNRILEVEFWLKGHLAKKFAFGTSQMALVGKNPPAKAVDVRDVGLIPGLGRSPGEGHGNPLQYSCLKSFMDRGALWAIILGVAHNWI